MLPNSWDMQGLNDAQPAKTTDLWQTLLLRELEKLDPTLDEEQRKRYLERIRWKTLQLTPDEETMVEWLLIKYHRISSRHRHDIGTNNEFKIHLTPKHDEIVYAQNLPISKNFKERMLIEFALQQEYGIFTTLPFSESWSSVFAQTKSNVKIFYLTWDDSTTL